MQCILCCNLITTKKQDFTGEPNNYWGKLIYIKSSLPFSGKKERYEETFGDESDNASADMSETYEILKSRFSFVYPHKAATDLPAKISVSALLEDRRGKDDDTTDETSETKEKYFTA